MKKTELIRLIKESTKNFLNEEITDEKIIKSLSDKLSNIGYRISRINPTAIILHMETNTTPKIKFDIHIRSKNNEIKIIREQVVVPAKIYQIIWKGGVDNNTLSKDSTFSMINNIIMQITNNIRQLLR